MEDVWDDEPDHTESSGELDREWASRRDKLFNVGYRDGLEEGKKLLLQQGFDQGFKDGMAAGLEWGRLRGSILTIHAFTQQQPQHFTTAQQVASLSAKAEVPPQTALSTICAHVWQHTTQTYCDQQLGRTHKPLKTSWPAQAGQKGTEVEEKQKGTQVGEKQKETEVEEKQKGTEVGEKQKGTEVEEKQKGTEAGENRKGTEVDEEEVEEVAVPSSTIVDSITTATTQSGTGPSGTIADSTATTTTQSGTVPITDPITTAATQSCTVPSGTITDSITTTVTQSTTVASSTIANPSSTIATPSSTIATPSSTIATPSSTIATPSSTIATPSSTIATPSSTIANPSSTIANPSGTIANPSATNSTSSIAESDPSVGACPCKAPGMSTGGHSTPQTCRKDVTDRSGVSGSCCKTAAAAEPLMPQGGGAELELETGHDGVEAAREGLETLAVGGGQGEAVEPPPPSNAPLMVQQLRNGLLDLGFNISLPL